MHMDKLKDALSKLVLKIFGEFLQRGGMLTRAGVPVDATMLASPKGGLPAIMWVVDQFYHQDYKLEFPELCFAEDSSAYTGYALADMRVTHSASPVLLMVSDFLRQEVLPEHVVEFDCDLMMTNFAEWCRVNVSPGQGTSPTARPDPEETP